MEDLGTGNSLTGASSVQRISEDTRAALAVGVVVLALLGGPTGTVRLRSVSGLPPGAGSKLLEAAKRGQKDFDAATFTHRADINAFTRTLYLEGQPVTATVRQSARGIVPPQIARLATEVLDVRFVSGYPVTPDGAVAGALLCFLPKAPTATQRRLCEAFAAQVSRDLENARLRDQQRTTAQRMRAINEAARAVAEEREPARVLQRIVNEAKDLVSARYAALALLGEKREVVEFVTAGLSPERVAAIGGPPAGHGLLGDLLQQSNALRVSDVSTHPRHTKFPRHHPVMQSFLGVRVAVEDQVLGRLYVANKEGAAEFTDDDEESLALLANHAAVAMENARLHWEARSNLDQAERARRDSDAVHGITRLAVSSLDLHEVLHRSLPAILEATGADTGEVWVLDPASNMLEIGARSGDPAAGIFEGDRFMLGTGIIGTTAATRQPFILTRAANRGHRLSSEFRDAGFRSLRAFPCVFQDAAVGVLCVASKDPRRLGDHEDRLLSRVADELAIAVRNAQLFSQARHADALEEANRLKDEFISMASHELRTPLTFLVGYTELLSKGLLQEEEIPKATAAVHEESLRLTRIVDDLLDIGRLESGRMRLNVHELDIGGLLEERVAFWRLATEKHTIRTDLPPEVSLAAADRARIGQVVDNLLSNAIAYSPDGGVITVALRQAGGELVVAIADQGIGIPAADLPHVFERFFRGASAKVHRARGTGLGLPVAHRLVELHGGRMWVESVEGQGSVFRFALPIWNARTAAEADATSAGEAVSTDP